MSQVLAFLIPFLLALVMLLYFSLVTCSCLPLVLLTVKLTLAAQPALLLPCVPIFLSTHVTVDDSCSLRMMSSKTGQLSMASLSPTGSFLPVSWTTRSLVSWSPRLFSADCLVALFPLNLKLYHLLVSGVAITSPTSSTLILSRRSIKTPSLLRHVY